MNVLYLIGCRWSLISGRLPGRTANDVKNFWNTNLRKKPKAPVTYHNDVVKRKEHWQSKQNTNNATAGTSTVVTNSSPNLIQRLPYYNLNPNYHMNSPVPGEIIQKNIHNNDSLFNNQPSPATPPSDQDGIEWWKNLSIDKLRLYILIKLIGVTFGIL